jgi:hypothetical protein
MNKTFCDLCGIELKDGVRYNNYSGCYHSDYQVNMSPVEGTEYNRIHYEVCQHCYYVWKRYTITFIREIKNIVNNRGAPI